METYRIHDQSSVYFVTYSIVEWLPVSVTDKACLIVADSLTQCHREKGLRINAFVIMPTHMHMIVFDEQFDNERLKKSLDSFRRFTGRQLAEYCSENMPMAFRDALVHSAGHDRERQFWQDSRHPEGLHTQKFWSQKWDYLHANPVRKGLVSYSADWRFSSGAFYDDEREYCGEVPITQIDW